MWKNISYKRFAICTVLLFIFTQIMWVIEFRTANLIQYLKMLVCCHLKKYMYMYLYSCTCFSGCSMLAFSPHDHHHSKTSCNIFFNVQVLSYKWSMFQMPGFSDGLIIYCDTVSCSGVALLNLMHRSFFFLIHFMILCVK